MTNTKNGLLNKLCLILVLGILLNVQMYAQENCNNGTDDDGDGLVDCFDPDCGCYTCNNEQDDYWVFGNGLSFDFNDLNSQGSPSYTNNLIYLNGQESYASVADPNGRFLFATNGVDIRAGAWTSTLMLVNPNNIILKGGLSSSHAAVVVPDPAAKNEYYIFTSDDATNNTHGVNQAKLKFENLSSSFGMEAHLSAPINDNLLLASESTEKLAVAKHSNCRDYWLVTHDFGASTNDGKNYVSYKVDPSGIGARINSPQNHSHVIVAGGLNSKKGQLSFSSDFTMLAAAIQGEGASSSSAVEGFIELTEFDPSTGIVTPYRVLPMQGRHTYGVCFSPTGRYLYVTVQDIVAPFTTRLLQYDLLSGASGTAGTVQEILNSEQEVPVHDNSVIPGVGGNLGQLKVGPNGRLYLAVEGRGIVEIVEPDHPTLSLNTNYLSFKPNTNARLGLPYTIPDFCQPSINATVSNNNICPGETVTVEATNVVGGQYTWNTGQNTQRFSASPQSTTNYVVTMTDSYGCSATDQVSVMTQNVPNVTGDFQFENLAGNMESEFQCDEDVFMNITASGATNHFIDIWEVLPNGTTGARLAPLGPTGWQGGAPAGRYNLTDMLSGIVNFEAGKTYEVKLVLIDPPCVVWTANTIPILHRFTITDVTSVFHFEDATGNEKTLFQCGEEIYMDGRDSKGESNHFIDLWEVTANGLAYITSLGWQGSAVNNVENLSARFSNVNFEAGKTYQVKLATQNPSCVNWVETVHNFTVAIPIGNPNFNFSFQGQTGSNLAQINLVGAPNALPLEHNWLIEDLSTGAFIRNSGWNMVLAGQNATQVFNNIPPGNYRIQHGVINVEDGCELLESMSRNLTIIWQKQMVKNGKVDVLARKEILDFNLYPNPTANILNIVTEENVEMIRIIDLNGRVLEETEALKINVQSLPTGIYIVELRTADDLAQKRFIKK